MALQSFVTALTAEASTTYGVNATPYNQGGEWWSSDGCSVVRDYGWAKYGGRWGWFNFHHACVHHDGCYRHHWASKETCDQWFLNDMRASCRAIAKRYPKLSEHACRDRAWWYYQGVRIFGRQAYNQRTHFVPMHYYA